MRNHLGRRLALLAMLVLATFGVARAQTYDSTTAPLQLLIMGSGLHQNDWGTQTSTNLQKLESAIIGVTTIATTGGTTTLTDDQARAKVLNITGALTANAILVVPARVKEWRVLNATTGAYTLTIQPSGGTGKVIPALPSYAHVLSDGSNVFLPGFLVAANNLSDLPSVSSALTNLGVSATGTDPTFLKLAGGTMTGGLNMGGQSLTNLATPASTSDATTKTYVDSAVSAVAGVPAGAVMAFNLAACPTGWKASDGTLSTVDLRGYFIRGLDTSGLVDASRTLGSLQQDALKSHSHFTVNTDNGGGSPTSTTSVTMNGNSAGGCSSCSYNMSGSSTVPTVGPTSATGDIETRPKNVALRYCQKS